MNLLYFIGGILFVGIIYPLIESILNLIITRIKVTEAKYSSQLNDINIQIQQAVAKAELDAAPPAHQIGFMIPNAEEYDEEDDDI